MENKEVPVIPVSKEEFRMSPHVFVALAIRRARRQDGAAEAARHLGEDVETDAEVIKDELDRFRMMLAERYKPESKSRLHQLLVTNGMPANIAEAFYQSGIENIADWLARKPSIEDSSGATDEQLAGLLEWSVAKGEEVAKDSELTEIINKSFQEYSTEVSDCIRKHQLHENWNLQAPAVNEVVIGNIFDRSYVGNAKEGNLYAAVYDKVHKAIVLWPYEHTQLSAQKHKIKHEMTHGKGGVMHHWLDEGLVERFTRLIDGQGDERIYPNNRSVVESLIEGAEGKISDYELSGLFLGDNLEENEQRMCDHFKGAYGGYDVLGTLLKIGDEIGIGNLTKSEHVLAVLQFVTTQTFVPLLRSIQSGELSPRHAIEELYKRAQQEGAEEVKLAYTRCAQMIERPS